MGPQMTPEVLTPPGDLWPPGRDAPTVLLFSAPTATDREVLVPGSSRCGRRSGTIVTLRVARTRPRLLGSRNLTMHRLRRSESRGYRQDATGTAAGERVTC